MTAPMRRLLLVLAIAILAVPAVATAQPAPRATAAQQAANEKLGRQLVTRFWALLKAQDQDGLRAFLSPAFQIQRANGTGANRNQYIPAVGKTIVIEDFALSDFKVTRAGGVVVARFSVRTRELIKGTSTATGLAPRIATFVQTPNGWRMTSNANFSVLAP